LVEAQPLSKVQLGHFLAAAQAPISHDDLFAEAGRKVLARHLLRLLDRQSLVRGGDPLALKQMRVAARRLRSTWRLFEGAYRRSEQKRHVAGLRVLGRRLGEVRDLDVLLEGLPDDPGLAPLAEAWRAERTEAFQRLLGQLDSARWRDLVARHRAFVGTPGQATSRRMRTMRLHELGSQRLDDALAQLRQSAAPSLIGTDDATLHRLRIHGKRLRYALETLRELAPSGPWARVHGRLVAMQDLLGEVNDAAVTAVVAERWLTGPGSTTNAAVRAAVARHVTRLRRSTAGRRTAIARHLRALHGRQLRRDMATLIAAVGRR
ncbi:MAG TPA: CHAD domain-containing protein, partial [Candidatus Limnocylindria bacterium]|nr:CHAD domain-containing protein [Candidatus Limnocylindria bacterium]